MSLKVSNLPDQFFINEFFVDIETGEITFEGNVQVVEPKVIALLQVLAQSPQQVVATDKLFELVWPQAIYSPNSVRRNIALLRKVLSDDEKQIIKTHPKRGYSLDAVISFANSKRDVSQLKTPRKKTLILASLFIPILLIASLFVRLNDSSKHLSLTNLTPVTATNGKERYMQVSPDGRFMAYIQNTQLANKRKLIIKDLITESHWELTKALKAYTYLAWDTHVNALVYSYRDEQGISFRRLFLDAKARMLNDEPLFSRNDITWNSLFYIDNHQNLYYLANQNGSEHSRNVSLYKHNLVSGHAETLLMPNDNFKPYRLALSPNQRQLALIGFNQQAISEVKLLDLLSNELNSVGLIDHNWHFLTWLKNSQSLLLSNGSKLNQLALNGELTTLNFKSFNFLLYPQVIEDKVYFIEAKSDQDILISNIDSLPVPENLINSNTVDTHAALSPDESHLAYMSMKNGFPQLFVKHINTGKERLLYANNKQELALAKPVWHDSGRRLASSINNKPFIISFNQNQFSTQWLTTVIGNPIAWYSKSDAILFVDKRTHNDELIKLNLETKEVDSLKIPLKRKRVFLNNKDELLSHSDGQVTHHLSGDTLIKDQPYISQVFPMKKGVYYQYSQNDTPFMSYYDYEQGKQNLSDHFDAFCSEFCSQITAIGDNTILLKEMSHSADVLVLDIVIQD